MLPRCLTDFLVCLCSSSKSGVAGQSGEGKKGGLLVDGKWSVGNECSMAAQFWRNKLTQKYRAGPRVTGLAVAVDAFRRFVPYCLLQWVLLPLPFFLSDWLIC